MTQLPSDLDTPFGNPEDQFTVSPAPLSPQAAAPQYGSEVPPKPPRQDMYAVDELAGGPVDDRTGNPATFTGGNLERGLGGRANPPEAGDTEGAAVVGERIGI